MRQRPTSSHGFTLIELLVVIAIIVTLGALAWSNLWRLRPRARLADASSELVALVHGARQHALASGRDVVVMVFPQFAGPESTGRVIVYEDGDLSLLTAGASPNFTDYDPVGLARGPRSDIVATYDLPPSIVMGPATGAGASEVMPAPLASIPVNVDCSFCKASGDRRGAIRFDPRGRAFFFSANAGNGQPALGVQGGSLSLSAPEVGGQRSLIVTSGTGAVSLRQQGG
jgi:prepilin-type N-terminal cleavage/methylation domain-containing protein